MKFNYKSRKGFTLIELLVVIGILAVLAAIAIPSVAGLIDRANVSADNNNVKEMTNAIERFTSEYQLVKNDIMSGTLDVNNMDAIQGRVYNVTQITMRDEVTKAEGESGFLGCAIDINTGYPLSERTFKKIIENYMKTSSSTFEPKQSDCSYFYCIETGVVLCSENGVTSDELNEAAKQNITLSSTPTTNEYHWLNITTSTTNDCIKSDGTSEVIAEPLYSAKFLEVLSMSFDFATENADICRFSPKTLIPTSYKNNSTLYLCITIDGVTTKYSDSLIYTKKYTYNGSGVTITSETFYGDATKDEIAYRFVRLPREDCVKPITIHWEVVKDGKTIIGPSTTFETGILGLFGIEY